MNENKRPTIAILGGTGKEGPGLALRWASNGYRIIIGSRQTEKAQATAEELRLKLGSDLVTGMDNASAAREADISILTVVQDAHTAALESVHEALQGKILVDATARVDFRNPVPPAAPSAGRQAQDFLGAGVRVVAAFQNVPAHALKKNLGQPLDMDVLVCADDREAAEEVIRLAEGAGMRAFFAGNLDNALVVEGITSLLIAINQAHKVKTATIRVTGLEPAPKEVVG